MPTFASWTRRYLARERGGASALEFALIVPLLIFAVGGITELGAYFQQVAAVEKGLRSAAMYAARLDLPLSSSALNTIDKIARTGQPSGGSNLVAGWSDAGATLNVTVTDTTVTDASSNATTVSVIRLTASLPFTPVVPVIEDLIGPQSLTIAAEQEQVHIGG